jgi:hypothetical protein
MHQSGFKKYSTAYIHLWHSYGTYWQIRLSYVLQILSRTLKLIAIPIALSIVITKLSINDFTGAKMAAIFLAAVLAKWVRRLAKSASTLQLLAIKKF